MDFLRGRVNFKTICQNLGAILVRTTRGFRRKFGKNLLKYDPNYKVIFHPFFSKERQEDKSEISVGEFFKEKRNKRKELEKPEESSSNEETEEKDSPLGDKTTLQAESYAKQNQDKMISNWGHAYTNLWNIPEESFIRQGLSMELSLGKLQSAPSFIKQFRKAPRIWDEMGLHVYKNIQREFFALSFPFLDPKLEKIPFTLANKIEYEEIEKEQKRIGQFVSLDQTKEDDEDGNETFERDKLEVQAGKEADDIERERAFFREKMKGMKSEALLKAANLYGRSWNYFNILRAINHFFDTGDVGESVKIGKFKNPRTFYNIRLRLGLVPPHELPPKEQNPS
jgi:hypothetical protein